MESLFIYLTDLSSGVAYLVILGILVACGLGLPLPEDIPLIAAGFLIWKGILNWPLTLVVTLFGVLAGDTLLYLLGKTLGGALLNNEGVQGFIKPEKVHRGRAYFRRFGDKIVFFARFVAGFRAAVYFTAGAIKMPYSRFIIYDFVAALISVPIWIGIGQYLGNKWGTEIEQILASMEGFKRSLSIGLAIVVTIVIGRFVWKLRRAKKLQK